MWSFVVDSLVSLFSSIFSWVASIFNAIPGSWDTLFTLFVIFMIARFLLGPIIGVTFTAGSDIAAEKTKDYLNTRKENRQHSTEGVRRASLRR